MGLQKYIVLILGGLFFAGCGHKEPSRLEQALQLSGNNRGELEKVLAHFSKDAADSLKLKAAVFLIENMPGHWGADSASISQYIAKVDSLEDLPGDIRRLLLNVPAAHPELFPEMKAVEDIRIVKSGQLIGHIEWAFSLMDSCEWLEHIGFDLFCEGILPYRIANEVLTFSYEKPDDALHAAYEYARKYFDDCRTSPFTMAMYIQRVREFRSNYHIKDKELREAADLYKQEDKLATLRLRRMGIPVTMEYDSGENPQYRNRQWSTPFDPRLYTKSFYEIVRLGSGKFYRTTYAHNPIPESDGKEYIPSFFQDPFQKDVTDSYLHTLDIELPVKLPDGIRYAYLAVYNTKEWIPVAYSEVDDKGICHFKKLGKDAVYLPVCYPDGCMQVLGAPFILCRNGERISKECDEKEMDTLHLQRTSAFMGKFNYANDDFIGSRIECADDETFTNPDTVHIINTFPNYKIIEEPFANEKKKRFWRLSLNCGFAQMSELHFTDKSGNTLSGRYIGDSKNNLKKDMEYLTDNIYHTQHRVFDWVGIDFGKPTCVEGVRYGLLAKGGNVLQEHEYELFYFREGKWLSVGKRIAGDQGVLFEDVPRNSLYQLVDNTYREPSDLFTIENGRIRFW